MPTFCDKCGHELKDENLNFCDKCGAKITKNKNNTTKTVSGIVCPSCGQTTEIGMGNCQNCGAPLETKDYTALIIIGYISLILGFIFLPLLIIGIIISIYLLTRKNNNKAKTHGKILIAIIPAVIIISFIIGFLLVAFSPY